MKLPTEIHHAYLQLAEPEDLLNVAGVSLQLRMLAVPFLWRNVAERQKWVRGMHLDMGREILDSTEAARVSIVHLCCCCSLSHLTT